MAGFYSINIVLNIISISCYPLSAKLFQTPIRLWTNNPNIVFKLKNHKISTVKSSVNIYPQILKSTQTFEIIMFFQKEIKLKVIFSFVININHEFLLKQAAHSTRRWLPCYKSLVLSIFSLIFKFLWCLQLHVTSHLAFSEIIYPITILPLFLSGIFLQPIPRLTVQHGLTV